MILQFTPHKLYYHKNMLYVTEKDKCTFHEFDINMNNQFTFNGANNLSGQISNLVFTDMMIYASVKNRLLGFRGELISTQSFAGDISVCSDTKNFVYIAFNNTVRVLNTSNGRYHTLLLLDSHIVFKDIIMTKNDADDDYYNYLLTNNSKLVMVNTRSGVHVTVDLTPVVDEIPLYFAQSVPPISSITLIVYTKSIRYFTDDEVDTYQVTSFDPDKGHLVILPLYDSIVYNKESNISYYNYMSQEVEYSIFTGLNNMQFTWGKDKIWYIGQDDFGNWLLQIITLGFDDLTESESENDVLSEFDISEIDVAQPRELDIDADVAQSRENRDLDEAEMENTSNQFEEDTDADTEIDTSSVSFPNTDNHTKNCSNNSLITLSDYTPSDDPLVVYLPDSNYNFKKAICMTHEELKAYLDSSRGTSVPDNIMTIYTTPEDFNPVGYGAKPTTKIVVKLPVNNVYVTMGSVEKMFRSLDSTFYALPLFGGKRRRIGNIKGIFGASMNHGQVPGFIVYKLYNKHEVPIAAKETSNDYPSFFVNGFTLLNDIVPDVAFVNALIDQMTGEQTTQQ
ncbi:hypothetical protein EB118_13380 [bacterium]|nr:hypothetical protein [bacterium]NDD83755.1 hypothetical protein [bacterium]NDG31044.1 hypothetical protein [bacterium]